MKNNVVLVLAMMWCLVSCEHPYENITADKTYNGNPFVSLSSEQASVNIGIDAGNNQTDKAGVFKDSLVLSHVLDEDLSVLLEIVDEETIGKEDVNFRFQYKVVIEAGKNYGAYTVEALDILLKDISEYKLSIRIAAVDNDNVIAGMYGAKKENEERQKRFKTYSFQN
nr:hypothetical protein [uncultured Carboxylicivirga sp.]